MFIDQTFLVQVLIPILDLFSRFLVYLELFCDTFLALDLVCQRSQYMDLQLADPSFSSSISWAQTRQEPALCHSDKVRHFPGALQLHCGWLSVALEGLRVFKLREPQKTWIFIIRSSNTAFLIEGLRDLS